MLSIVIGHIARNCTFPCKRKGAISLRAVSQTKLVVRKLAVRRAGSPRPRMRISVFPSAACSRSVSRQTHGEPNGNIVAIRKQTCLAVGSSSGAPGPNLSRALPNSNMGSSSSTQGHRFSGRKTPRAVSGVSLLSERWQLPLSHLLGHLQER